MAVAFNTFPKCGRWTAFLFLGLELWCRTARPCQISYVAAIFLNGGNVVRGYFALHRQILDSDVFEDPRTLKAFIWCLCRANYTWRTFQFHGEKITLLPGQFVSGRLKGATECGFRPSTFRNQIKKLEKMGSIATESDNKKTIFTVVNWSRYQADACREDNGRTAGGHRQEGKKKRKEMDENNQHPQSRSTADIEDGKTREKDRERHGIGDSTALATQFVDFFCDQHTALVASPYVVHGAKDRNAAKALVDSLGLEEAQARAIRYLTREDPWTREHGFSIGNMWAVINGLAGCGGRRTHEKRFLFEDEVEA